MGAAHEQRGCANLTRPYHEAADHERWIVSQLSLSAAAERSVEYCRGVNARLAVIATGRLPVAHIVCLLNGRVGQVRYGKYLDACHAWRCAKSGASEWHRAIDMKQAAVSLMRWLGE